MIKRGFLFCIFAWSVFVIWKLGTSTDLPVRKVVPTTVNLRQGPFTIRVYPSRQPITQAIVLFGSGDGGWGSLESTLCRAGRDHGYEMVGIDFEEYAESDYDLETLQDDFTTIAKRAMAPFGDHPPPLIVGGYSMGAAQAVAVVGGPHPPPGLVGLILVDPCSRGRYGLRSLDQLNILPTGPGTFSVESFARTMPKLKVVQWHAEDDSIDSQAWLNSLKVPHREFTFPGTGHEYDTNREKFVQEWIQSIDWILNSSQTAVGTPGTVVRP